MDIQLLKQKDKKYRLDVTPFLILYAIVIYLSMEVIDEVIYSKILFLSLLLIHLIVYLCNHWSKRFSVMNEYYRTDKLDTDTYVGVTESKPNQKKTHEICKLIKKDNDYYFYYHNKKFIYNQQETQFIRLKQQKDIKIQDYLDLDKEYVRNKEYYDENVLDIPIKNFYELLKDQLMEPLSFFQFISVSLWLMDENRFYALLTLFMLFMTSCTVALQRIRTLMTLRQMKLNNCYMNRYDIKTKKWTKSVASQLQPGDIIQIESSNEVQSYNNIEQEQQKDREYIESIIPFSDRLPPQFFNIPQLNTSSYSKIQADIVILQGNCIVDESILTGESLPQIKEQLEISDSSYQLDPKNRHRNNIIYCGTDILQTYVDSNSNIKGIDNMCIGRVLKTQFDTQKGKLIRTVLYNNENINVKQYDAFILIIILLIISIISSGYVLYHGLQDKDRDRNKLFLRCILIVTTVVPPELPMIITIAVNSSLMYLQGLNIFCSEPFRIPLAGKVSKLCFDKTGTLTSDSLNFKSIQQNDKEIDRFSDADMNVQKILGSCHSLISQSKQILGDPIEKLFFQQSDWEYSHIDKIAINKKQNQSIKIIKTYYFKSEFKRMSAIILDNDNYKVVSKGAPETILSLLRNQSDQKFVESYNEQFLSLSQKGYRVLALAHKKLDSAFDPLQERQNYENDLEFSGFMVLENKLKDDTLDEIRVFKKAQYQIVIITGDNILTAISVSYRLGLKNIKQYLLVEVNDGKLQLKNKIDHIVKEYDFSNKSEQNRTIKTFKNELSTKYVFAIEGSQLQTLLNVLQNNQQKSDIVDLITVFARTTPAQKEQIIILLKMQNQGTLMCGDGTNDVGALKKADVGIALVSLDEKKKKKRQQKQQDDPLRDISNQLDEYKYGDACIAAPFTSKMGTSIGCVNQILRQGICTQVVSIQTYKILTLTSIISAYSFTALHLQSLKFSETQSTIQGILMAINYYNFSNSQPLKQIAPIRPDQSIFTPLNVVSTLLQLGLHLYAQEIAIWQIGMQYDTLEVNHDAEFVPTWLNTVAFFINFISMQCIFLFNHPGQPFSESLLSNKKYLKILIIPLLICLMVCQNVSQDVNYMLELNFQNIPDSAMQSLLKLMISVIGINFIIEFCTKYLKYGKIYDLL